MSPQWESWLNNSHQGGADAAAHGWMMKGVAKCAVASGFVIQNHDGSQAVPGPVGPLHELEERRRSPGRTSTSA